MQRLKEKTCVGTDVRTPLVTFLFPVYSYFQSILAVIFVTIATVKVEVIRDFYTLVIVLIN